MKRHMEAVARRESTPRQVKKVKTAKPPLFAFWNRLPNEIKAMIVEKMDVKTSVSFKESGPTELELVRNHTRNFVDISLNVSQSPSNRRIEKMHIEVKDAISKEIHLKWIIYSSPLGTKIEYLIMSPGFRKRTRTRKTQTVGTATSTILRRLLTEPTFVVNELNFCSVNFDQKIDLDSISANVGLLTLEESPKSELFFPILQNKNLNFKKIVGVDYEDRLMLYEHDVLTYGQPRTLPADSMFLMDRAGDYYSFVCEHRIYSHESAYGRFKNFWNITLGLYDFVNINAVNETLELRKTVDDIMILRAAYYYSDECIPYIQGDREYSNRIAFLEDGIDEHLSDYQITILSIAYLVRLLRNEPEIKKIYNLAFEDLRLVLKKFENVNLFEKLVAKLEALVP